MNTQYITATQIQTVLGVGRAKAYAIVKTLNNELADMGYITVAGKCRQILGHTEPKKAKEKSQVVR